jgi:hypothetical protein
LTGALRPGLKRLWALCRKAAMVVAGKQSKEIHMTATSPQESAPGKAPSHVAYQVRDREGKKSFWTRIGSAWAHADGKGFNIQLEVVPLDGRITLRIASEKKE